MPFPFGQNWSSHELRERAGHLEQLAGVKLVTLAEGKARGMRVAGVWTAGSASASCSIATLERGPA